MEKRISVPIELRDRDEYISIPLRYTVEQENDSVQNIYCKVDLARERLEDLGLSSTFNIRKVYTPGGGNVAGCTAWITSHNKFISLNDAALCGESIGHIRVREIYLNKLNNGYYGNVRNAL